MKHLTARICLNVSMTDDEYNEFVRLANNYLIPEDQEKARALFLEKMSGSGRMNSDRRNCVPASDNPGLERDLFLSGETNLMYGSSPELLEPTPLGDIYVAPFGPNCDESGIEAGIVPKETGEYMTALRLRYDNKTGSFFADVYNDPDCADLPSDSIELFCLSQDLKEN